MRSRTCRPTTTSSLGAPRSRPRWEQIAANSVVPVHSFLGFQDLKNKNALLRLSQDSVTARSAQTCRQETASLESILSDPECQDAAQHVDDLSEKDAQFLLKLAEFLRLTAQDAAMKGNYDKAKECREKRDIVIQEFRRRKPRPPENNAIDEQERIIREHREKWDDEVKEFDEETDQKVEEYKQKNEQALAELDDDWQNILVEKYRKPSATLIKQRTLETEMIRKDQIEKAQWIHEGVAQLEKREMQQAQANFERDYKEARDGMIAQQDQDFDQFMYTRMNQRQLLLNRIQRDEITLMNRLNVLHQKPEPLPPYKKLLAQPVAARPTAVIGDDNHNPGKKLPMLRFVGGGAQTQRPKSSFSQTTTNKRDEDDMRGGNNTKKKGATMPAKHLNQVVGKKEEEDPKLDDVMKESLKPTAH